MREWPTASLEDDLQMAARDGSKAIGPYEKDWMNGLMGEEEYLERDGRREGKRKRKRKREG
jgi:hypothetical protein